jgi:hypothetical protein
MQRFRLIWLVSTVLVVAALVALGAYASAEREPQPTQRLTPVPGLKATLTALPLQPDMPAQEAQPYQEIRAMASSCAAYPEQRRIAVLQQIDYVLHPSTLPRDFLIQFGDHWRGRMIYGSAYLTALEWKLQGQDKTSCLYSIGVRFNTLLPGLGEQPLPDFQ